MSSASNGSLPTKQDSNLFRQQVAGLLHRLSLCYYNTQFERRRIRTHFRSKENVPILDEIEALTSDIRGYASQLQTRGWIRDENDAIDHLQTLRVFDVPEVAQLYFGCPEDYHQVRSYLQLLDYLRLVMLEHLLLDQM